MKRINKKERTLRPVYSSIGLECEYRRRLDGLIEEMNRSVCYWLEAAFKGNPPELLELKDEDQPLALDATPANVLRRAVRKRAKQWQRQFNEASIDLAKWFALSTHKRSTSQLKAILKKGGWTVDLKLTPAQKDILQATVHENVGLIRSIPQNYFNNIEGMVMRSVQAGGDLKSFSRGLERNFKVTKKRARLIARDQNNKATGSFHRVQQIELGIEEAIWLHSHAGKKPRPSHVKNDGKRYNVKTGWYDPHEQQWIHPGQLINCRCISRSIIPGFS